MLDFLMHGSLTTSCLIALITGLIFYWLINRLRYSYPPGPTGLPLLGNALQVDQKKLHEQLFEWSKKYGPVITVKLGLAPFVYINSIDSAMEVLVKKSADFAGRLTTPSLDVFSYGGKDIVFANYGATWKLQRRITSKALRHYMQGDALQNRIHDAVETALLEINMVCGEFDPAEYINFIVGNILTGLCFGGKYEFNDKEVHYILEKEDESAQKFGLGTWEDFIPGLRYVYKTEGFKAVEELTAEIIENFIGKKFKQALNTFDKDNIRHFTDTLILARMEAEQEEGESVMNSLSEEHLVQTLADIFFAGVDTSRYTLYNAILHMVAFPDIQQKVQEEIDRVVGK